METTSRRRQVTALSENAFSEALRRSVATMADAVAATEAAIDALGSRAFLDPFCKKGDRVVYVRDPERPEWLPAQPYLVLEIGFERPEPVFREEDYPPEVRALFANVPKPIERQVVSPDPRPGMFTVQQGRRIFQVTIDRKGIAFEWMRSAGDPWGDASHRPDERGFCFDPDLLVHDQPQPVDLLARADLDSDGEPPREIGRKLAEHDNAGDVSIRVRMPVPVPGGVRGCALGVLHALKQLTWEGDLDDPGEGWLVVDGFDHRAIASGATFDEAWAAWNEEVRRVRPKPPPPPVIPEDLREAYEEAKRRRDAGTLGQRPPDDGEGAPGAEIVKKGDKVTMKAEFSMMMIPPREMDWPSADVENVPAVALRLPPRPRPPDRLQVMGFTRTIRLFGDHGEVAHAFVRTDPKGFTVVGEDAARAIDPATFDADLRAADEVTRRDAKDWGDERDPLARHPEYPWRSRAYAVLAPDKRSVGKPRPAGVGHGAEWNAWGFDAGARWLILRVDRP